LRFAVAGLLLAACSSGTTHARATPPPATASTTTTSVARGPLPIRQTKIDVDGTNVFVVSPSNAGRYPLVVFSHGYQSTAEAYTAFFEQLARMGYVVAGPDYPQSAFATHPPIITKVIDRLTQERSVDPNAIAVGGHSLGGLDALGVGYDTCCRDPRVRAVMVFESPRIDFPGGSYLNQGPPILVVQGDQDPLIPVPTAADITHPLTTASYEVLIPGGMHGGGLDPGDPGRAAVAQVVTNFLAAFLHNDAVSRHWLATTTQVDGSRLIARRPL
jgi:predicted dienelactone hydrolase